MNGPFNLMFCVRIRNILKGVTTRSKDIKRVQENGVDLRGLDPVKPRACRWHLYVPESRDTLSGRTDHMSTHPWRGTVWSQFGLVFFAPQASRGARPVVGRCWLTVHHPWLSR